MSQLGGKLHNQEANHLGRRKRTSGSVKRREKRLNVCGGSADADPPRARLYSSDCATSTLFRIPKIPDYLDLSSS